MPAARPKSTAPVAVTLASWAIYSLLCPAMIHGNVVISEIMYNPAGTDFSDTFNREWVEIFNPAATAVDLSGWQFGDSRANQWATPFPIGTTLGPLQALVVTGDAATFDANWGPGVNRIEVGNFPALTNNPSPTAGFVALRDQNARIRDEVSYDDAFGWPTSNGDQGSSIFLLPTALSPIDNDLGTNWRPSSAGVYRARYVNGGGHGTNYGSPGYVATIPQAQFTPSPDSLWSMVVIPDMQNYVKLSANNPIFSEMTTWIKDNRDAFNIQLALHEGDIVNRNQGTPTNGENSANVQWSNAKSAMSILDGVVPYVLAVGNHDLGTTSAENRNTQLNNYFRASDNPLVDPASGGILRGTYQSGRLENAFYELRAPDGRELLILSLEFGPRQAVVDWARQVVQRPEYQEHSVILLTHEFLTGAVAGGLWNQAKGTMGRSMKRPAAAPTAAMDLQRAAKYCGFGRTKFRQLVSEGVFPPPVAIDGLKRDAGRADGIADAGASVLVAVDDSWQLTSQRRRKANRFANVARRQTFRASSKFDFCNFTLRWRACVLGVA